MGLLDSLLGRSKPVRANLDALFALPSAAVTMEAGTSLLPTGRAGICWKPPPGRTAEDAQKEIETLLEMGPDGPAPAPPTPPDPAGTSAVVPATAPQMRQAEDAYGYRWLLLDDPAIDDLVGRVHLVNSTLTDNGWGPQLLCSVFGFAPAPGSSGDDPAMYLVYLYKRGTFYPFAPDGHEHRDTQAELHLQAVLGADLPMETDLTRWFPLWDLPVGSFGAS